MTTSSGSDMISTGFDLTDNVSTCGLLIDLAIRPISSLNVLRFGRMNSDIRESRFRGWGGGSGGVDEGGSGCVVEGRKIYKKSIKF